MQLSLSPLLLCSSKVPCEQGPLEEQGPLTADTDYVHTAVLICTNHHGLASVEIHANIPASPGIACWTILCRHFAHNPRCCSIILHGGTQVGLRNKRANETWASPQPVPVSRSSQPIGELRKRRRVRTQPFERRKSSAPVLFTQLRAGAEARVRSEPRSGF